MKILILIICLLILFNFLQNNKQFFDNKKNKNLNFKIKDLCEKYKNKTLDLIITGGNKGDGLIYEGIFKYLNKNNIKYRIIDNNNPRKKNNILFISGGGGFSSNYCSTPEHLNIIKKYNDVWIFPSSIDCSVEKNIKFLKNLDKSKVKIFCRELKSFYEVPNYFKGEVFLDDDTAFNLDYSKWYKRGNGILYALRNDKEKNNKVNELFKGKKINDVSKGNHVEWKTLLDEISKYEVIYTNRAHVSIAGTLLGKKTYVYPSNYFKQEEIYKYSLSKYPNCKFIKIL